MLHMGRFGRKDKSRYLQTPHFAIELERARGATEPLLQEELLNVIAEDLAAEVITSSLRELQSVKTVEDVASAAETIHAVACDPLVY